ncbi:DUF3592 domain-containing protein [Streptomyces sp. Ncost-T10-10d]|uniref:DUF3592 domain-containing protein n=1 Tax=Streptomyces sp. Ncost-T10-10d TaxID=1839774 RepID=UPI00081F3607|nr:DUF3592 domain-containing protein [Streptomyces sp. Ncost-T10-10d]SCF74817.1 Protein of unknown function [Streptomyces sp. Ncost-T10-10d]
MQILPGGTATFLLLFGLFLGAFAVRSALRLHRVLRLVRHGEHAEGRCADRRTIDRGPGMDRSYATEYVFAFRTRDGRDIEFTDHAPGPFGFEVGAPVRVSYDPAAPSKHATVAGPRAWGPVVMPAVFAVVLGLFAVGLLVGFAAMRGWL